MQRPVDTAATAAEPAARNFAAATAMPVLFALSLAHLLNDMMQSLVPAIYPIIKETHDLSFSQIGLITLTFELTASLLQPAVGHFTDKRPLPFSMVAGMGFTLVGLVVLAWAPSYPMLLLGAALVGTGSSIFHPEATRAVRVASGGRQGFAQSIFQVGGRAGSALGPVLAAFIVVPWGQGSVAWFAVAAMAAMVVLLRVGRWYALQLPSLMKSRATGGADSPVPTSAGVIFAVAILVLLMFSKSAFQAAFMSFYTFFLIDKFGTPIATAQLLLFVYLVAGALGVLIGGPLGDRIGRRRIIWFSILGALPFSLLIPHVNLFWTVALSTCAALIMASAFAAILIYAMELLPGRVGLIGGLFYGLTFGLGAVSAALLGVLADVTDIRTIFVVTSIIPALGILTWLLPDIRSD